MDLQTLVTTHENLAHQRKNLGQNYCEQGYACLIDAEQMQYQDKSLLKQAARFFVQAIRHERSNAEPYIGLGYVLLLVSDFDGAERQFKAALQLEPGNRDAEALLQFLYQKKSGTLPAYDPAIDSGAPINYPRLLAQTEQMIQAQLLHWNEASPPIPAIESKDIQYLKDRESELETLCQNLEQDFQRLEIQYEPLSLRQLAAPLFEHWTRYRTVLAVSQTFQKHKKTLDALMHDVKQAFVELKQMETLTAIRAFEADKLESILDRCDGFADTLDYLERQGHDILALEHPYNMVILVVENLQTQLDEKLDDLS